MEAKKYSAKMFVDYDRCVRHGREKLCINCPEKQREKCRIKNA